MKNWSGEAAQTAPEKDADGYYLIENGEDLFAQDVGGRYFALLSLVDLPKNETVEIEVTPYSIFFGKRILGEAQKFVWNQK